METLETLFHRKSVRHFTGAAVSKEALETLLRAGMAAPSAVNKQPWAFVAVTLRETMDQLAEGLPYARMLAQAGAAIVVCGIPEKANNGMLEYAVIDCSAATENILLAAEAMGLGAVWTAVYPRPEREAWVRHVLDLPGNVLPLCVIPIGHPTGVDQAKDKFNPGNIHWERW